MQPLDFIKTKDGSIGIITNVKPIGCAVMAYIVFIEAFNGPRGKGWYVTGEFEVIDNIADVLRDVLDGPQRMEIWNEFIKRMLREEK